ncbi:DNA/RNA polymerase [Tricholoma matsutake]|nr:DNA/RNA polymerase [Tricholoma matsutake 945]
MLNSVLCKITLKDADKAITTRNYSCPRKYQEAWSILIQRHMDAGCIQPSSSAHTSPVFLVPKADAGDLPCWVNDYRQLNSNTVTDSHPLPCVDNILADAVGGVPCVFLLFFMFVLYFSSLHFLLFFIFYDFSRFYY